MNVGSVTVFLYKWSLTSLQSCKGFGSSGSYISSFCQLTSYVSLWANLGKPGFGSQDVNYKSKPTNKSKLSDQLVFSTLTGNNAQVFEQIVQIKDGRASACVLPMIHEFFIQLLSLFPNPSFLVERCHQPGQILLPCAEKRV